ncbi:hypothetical protein [Ornithinimicrobium kibberense]|uniref:hypothetical protein n=1 Tax=Ornithinimicrobium kibberense TaxID=282060 RepID=UPI003607C1E8
MGRGGGRHGRPRIGGPGDRLTRPGAPAGTASAVVWRVAPQSPAPPESLPPPPSCGSRRPS